MKLLFKLIEKCIYEVNVWCKKDNGKSWKKLQIVFIKFKLIYLIFY